MGTSKFILILLLLVSVAYGQSPLKMLTRKPVVSSGGAGVVGQFNFSGTTNTVSDWVNVVGNPDAAVLTGSDSRSGTPIGVSTITASDPQVWTGNGGVASANVGATGTGHVLPVGLYQSYFFNNDINYVTGKPCIEISGLDPAKTYKFEILSSRQVGTGTDPRTTIITCIDNAGTTNATVSSGNYNGDFNYVVTGKIPDSGGRIYFFIGKGVGFQFAYMNAIKITQE